VHAKRRFSSKALLAQRSTFRLLDPAADEEDPDSEHRDEHAEDDARSHQIDASESVHE
jgi:hypothetical protein